jgi:hypothetical protein
MSRELNLFYLKVSSYGSKLLALCFFALTLENYIPKLSLGDQWFNIAVIESIIVLAGVVQYFVLKALYDGEPVMKQMFLLVMTFTAGVDLGIAVLIRTGLVLSHPNMTGTILFTSIYAVVCVSILSVFLFWKKKIRVTN